MRCFSVVKSDDACRRRLTASPFDVIPGASTSSERCYISNLPDGYHTLVGERGMLISGGERQRISLVRAILKNAPIPLPD